MSIAETIKAAFNNSNNWDQLLADCERYASNDIDQDWDNESTQYNFVDNSCIVVSGPFVSAYNSQK